MEYKKKLRIFYNYWMSFAKVLGTINSYIILTFFYIFLIGPYSIILKLLNIFRQNHKSNHWTKMLKEEINIESLKNQF